MSSVLSTFISTRTLTGIPSPVFGCVIGANHTGRFLRRCATGTVRLLYRLIARVAIRKQGVSR
ncbi:hypothetical protein CFBP6625_16810 [Agrobacterium tumefaciens]|nr:hypothetical protein CFBP6625_16810 [Agrobacterium tumefaciens]